MRPYEVMVIVDPDLDDAVIQSSLDRAKDALTSNGGLVNRLDPWGRRTLAYEIRHKRQGFYALFEVTSEPAAVQEMDRVLRLDDNVMRHKVIRIPDEVAGRARPSEDTAAQGG